MKVFLPYDKRDAIEVTNGILEDGKVNGNEFSGELIETGAVSLVRYSQTEETLSKLTFLY